MKTKGKFDIFISHATADSLLAAALRDLICSALKLDTKRVFVSSDGESLQLGEKGEPQITEAHKSAKAVVALMTPRSIFRPWVIYESGGADFQAGKPLFVVLANGAEVASLPEPLKHWQATKLTSLGCLESLCSLLRDALRRRRAYAPPQEVVDTVLKLASQGTGDWARVNVALVAARADRSPFNMEGILTEGSPESARKEVRVIGLKLSTLAGYEDYFKGKIFAWLKADRSRSFHVTICGPSWHKEGKAWMAGLDEQFGNLLTQSTSVFRRWVREARAKRLSFHAATARVIPITAVFVDPSEDYGYVVLTPIVYNRRLSDERPHFVVGRKQNEAVFEYYWTAYSDPTGDRRQPLK
jgi:hypothetical protein